MARRRRRLAVNTKLIFDVISASLIVQKAPALISQFITLEPMMAKIAGVGAGYAVGVMMKRPDISNASLGLGVTDFIAPLIDQFIGGITLPETSNNSGNSSGAGRLPPAPEPAGWHERKYPTQEMSDFVNLNEYVLNPGRRMSERDYRDSY